MEVAVQAYPILAIAVGLMLAACDGSSAPSTSPSTAGTLVVSTASEGNDPDRDGYLLTVDGIDSLPLDPTGTSRISLPAGRHTLGLLGMAEHCSVSPAVVLDVAVSSGDTTSVAFQVTCSVTGVRITTTTTGLDVDADGYRLAVDGVARGILPSSGAVLTRLDAGAWRIALTGLAPNCTFDGLDSHTVTVVASEIALVGFAVVCTATSGVIGVVVEASGTDVNGSYRAIVDGAGAFRVSVNAPAYLADVPAGDHVVSLVAPPNCSVEDDPQSVSVTAGGLIRDTVQVVFSVTCVPHFSGTLRITAPTTGSIPTAGFSVWICRVVFDCLFQGQWNLLGALAPNGALVANPRAGRYQLNLRDVPARCSVRPSSRLSPEFTVTENATTHIEFRVTCSP
jgi:hypothetical protein